LKELEDIIRRFGELEFFSEGIVSEVDTRFLGASRINWKVEGEMIV